MSDLDHVRALEVLRAHYKANADALAELALRMAARSEARAGYHEGWAKLVEQNRNLVEQEINRMIDYELRRE